VEHGGPDIEERARDLYAAFVTDHPDASEATIAAFIDSNPSEAAVLRHLVGLRRSLTDMFAVALPDPNFVGRPGEAAREATPALSTHSIREGFVIGDFTLVRHLGRGGECKGSLDRLSLASTVCLHAHIIAISSIFRWIAAITAAGAIVRILEHLSLPSVPPTPAPPRAPPQLELWFEGC
jgi:hypothetical protein